MSVSSFPGKAPTGAAEHVLRVSEFVDSKSYVSGDFKEVDLRPCPRDTDF